MFSSMARGKIERKKKYTLIDVPPHQSFMVSESEVLQRESLIPVYVVPEDDQLLCMYEEVKQAAAARTSSIFVRGEMDG